MRIPERRSLRRRPAGRGAIDAARTVREQLRRAGEPGPLKYRRPQTRPRRIVFLIDISGSMEPYADSLLRLAHRVVTAAPRTTEVFTVGTQLTRVTLPMRLRDPELALLAAGQSVPDWSGGTRLGEMIREFLGRWGRRGVARGAVVVIASDGWSVAMRRCWSEQMQQLRRLARGGAVVRPHSGRPGMLPSRRHCGRTTAPRWTRRRSPSLAFADLLELIADA